MDADKRRYSLLAVLHEINKKELKNRMALFPEDQHYLCDRGQQHYRG